MEFIIDKIFRIIQTKECMEMEITEDGERERGGHPAHSTRKLWLGRKWRRS